MCNIMGSVAAGVNNRDKRTGDSLGDPSAPKQMEKPINVVPRPKTLK